MTNEAMSANEQRARTMLTDAIQKGVPALQLLAAMGGLPTITDQECISMAVNYIYAWQDIRKTFPKA